MKKEKIIYFSFIILALVLMIAGISMVYYPSLYEEQDFGSKHHMFKWIGFSYITLFIFSFIIEKLYVMYSSTGKTYFKDITLEFSELLTIKTEKEFLEKCNNIMKGNVLEVSFIYNLSEYFNLERKKLKIIEEINEKKNKIDEKKNLFNQKEIEKIDLKIKEFVEKLKNKPTDYFTGQGFITFRNYKYANLFRIIYKKSQKKKIKRKLLSKKAKKPLGKFKNSVNKLILGKRPSFSVKDALKLKEEDNTVQNRAKRPTMIKKPPTNLNLDKKRFSISNFKKVTNLFMYQNVKEYDIDNIENMKRFFGKNFKIKRGNDPNCINFDFTNSRTFSIGEKLFFVFIFFLLLPSIAYYFNYLYYFYFTKRHIVKSFAQIWIEYLSLIGTVIVDMFSLFLIQMFFDQKHFLKSSKMFIYKLGFSCFYILLSNIIIPNFALKAAFLQFSDSLNNEEKKETIEFLVHSLYMNFYLLMFSGINFKIINPFIINKYILKNNKRKSENDNIIFSLSFVINSIFQISFYSTITTDVHLYFFVYILLFFALDLFLEKKNILKAVNLKKKKIKLPITIFTNALIILIFGIFPVCCLGYYGLSNSFQELMKEPEEKTGFLNYFFNGLISIVSYFSGFLNIVPNHEYERGFYYMVILNVKNIISNFIFLLITDINFSLSFMTYFIFSFLFIQYYTNEKFLSRIQSKKWALEKKIENIKFVGLSFREINPAYKLMGRHLSHLTTYRDKIQN